MNKKYKKLKDEYEWLLIDYRLLLAAKEEIKKQLTERTDQLIETRKILDEKVKKLNEYREKRFGLYINKIVHNKEKGTTVVWFDNKEKVIVKKRKGVKDDVYSAVAYAIAERLYGNNTTFKKVVDMGVKN